MLRTIKSFVIREGRMTAGQKHTLAGLALKYSIHSTEPLHFAAEFNNSNPIVLEIGFGTGDSLFKQAQNHPELNFVGIEVYRTGIAKLCNNLAVAGVENVRYLHGDAVELIKKIPNDSLLRVQIFFPDPWPKARHHKRRIVQPEFIQLLAQKLAKGGILHLATDWSNYAEYMQEVVEIHCAGLFEKIGTSRPDFRPVTKFESKGLSKGHIIHDLLYKLI